MFVKYDRDNSKVFLYKHAASSDDHASAVDADGDFDHDWTKRTAANHPEGI